MRYHRPVSHRSLLVSALGLILGSACAGADDGGSQASVTPTGSTGQSETDGSSGTQGPSTSTATTGGMAATGSTGSSGDTANTSSAVSSSGINSSGNTLSTSSAASTTGAATTTGGASTDGTSFGGAPSTTDGSNGGSGGSSSTTDGSGGSGGSSSTSATTGGGPVAPCPTKVEGFGENVTGGQGGDVVTAHTGTEIHKAICDRPADDTPLVVMVDGTITPGNTLKQSGSCNTADGVIELKEISNISLIGVGTNGVLDQIGIHIRSSSNIIIQNLTIKNIRKSNTNTPSNGGDAIGMESDVSNIWIDHNLIFGSTTEGEEHDGLIDIKDNTTDVTISCNHLHTGGRGGLVGSSDSGDDGSTRITWHHNWYQNLNSRTHLVREAHGHAYNNYYSQILSTGINSRNGAQLLIEGNYFTEARNPLGTFFYLDNPGVWEVHDNYFDTSVTWETASDQIPAGPNVQSTGSVSVPYDYTLHPVQEVPAIVMAGAGVGKL